MIVSNLEHVDRQAAMTEGLEKAMDFLRKSTAQNLPNGRIDIDGEKVFALIQRYVPGAVKIPAFEFHRKYLDVQFVASGSEVIGWMPASKMNVVEKYDPLKDICFGDAGRKNWTPILLEEGDLAFFWPEDAHAPKLAALSPQQVLKIVVKVLL